LGVPRSYEGGDTNPSFKDLELALRQPRIRAVQGIEPDPISLSERPEGIMGRYRISVATGAWLFSGSHNRVRLWLVGAHGEAELELQLRLARGEVCGQELEVGKRQQAESP
jgi:hypothetical protein